MHLVMPQKDVFADDQDKPTASVLVASKPEPAAEQPAGAGDRAPGRVQRRGARPDPGHGGRRGRQDPVHRRRRGGRHRRRQRHRRADRRVPEPDEHARCRTCWTAWSVPGTRWSPRPPQLDFDQTQTTSKTYNADPSLPAALGEQQPRGVQRRRQLRRRRARPGQHLRPRLHQRQRRHRPVREQQPGPQQRAQRGQRGPQERARQHQEAERRRPAGQHHRRHRSTRPRCSSWSARRPASTRPAATRSRSAPCRSTPARPQAAQSALTASAAADEAGQADVADQDRRARRRRPGADLPGLAGQPPVARSARR